MLLMSSTDESPEPVGEAARLVRALVQAVHHGICVVDAGGVITDVDEELIAMTGFDRGTLVGSTPPHAYWPEEHREQFGAALKDALAGNLTDVDLVACRKDGSRFPARVTMSAVAGDGAGPDGVVAALRDTSRETGERELLREAHRVARFVSWEYDPRSDSIVVSEPVSELMGAEVPRVTTLEQALELLLPDDARAVRDELARVGAGDGSTILESELIPPDHDLGWALPRPAVRWVETRMRAIRDPSGTLTGAVHGTTQDITGLKLADLAGRESEHRLRQAQRVAGLGSFEVDCRTREVMWSPELYRLFDVHAGTFSGDLDYVLALMPAEDAAALTAMAAAVVGDGEPRDLQHQYLRGTELRHAETRLELLAGRRGVRGTMQDVTARRAAETEIRLRGELLDAVAAAVICTDASGTVTHWNRGAERLYGWGRAEALGRPLRPLTLDADERAGGCTVLDRIVEAGDDEGARDLSRKDGTRFRGYVRRSLLRDATGAPAGVIGVTVRAASAADGVETQDHQHAIADSMDQGLCTLDSDGRLVYINLAAQQLLGWSSQEVVGRLMHEVVHPPRGDGSPSAGEVCPLRPAYESGVVVHLDDDIFVRKDGSELPVEITASPCRGAGGELEAVVVFTDVRERRQSERRLLGEVERVAWVGRIRDALDADRFVVYAQPITDLTTGAPAGHELLIRMLDAGGLMIPPHRFLPAAEQYGLVTEIDRWMLGQAVELAGRGHAVTVNLSARSVGAPRIAEELRGALAESDADPALLVIELKESSLLEYGPAAGRLIDGIREAGCKLAIDDFGTGLGGFTHLRRLPFDYLKIDAEFVRDLTGNPASRDVVREVVGLAHGFGQQTVAEGVEDERTLDLLRELGVDLAQGFALGRPAPATDVFGAAESMPAAIGRARSTRARRAIV